MGINRIYNQHTKNDIDVIVIIPGVTQIGSICLVRETIILLGYNEVICFDTKEHAIYMVHMLNNMLRMQSPRDM